MSVIFRVGKYTAPNLLEQIKNSYAGLTHDKEEEWNKILLPHLKESNFPKEKSFVFEGVYGDGGPTKIYFFNHKDKFYTYTLIGGFNSGQQYSPQAEQVFDKIATSTQFN